jgi:hypothetical protein
MLKKGGKKMASRWQRAFFAAGVIVLCSFCSASAVAATAACPAGEMDLSEAMAYGDYWIKNGIYVLGGGHSPCYQPGCSGNNCFDCSGFASAILHLPSMRAAGSSIGCGLANTLEGRATTPGVIGKDPVVIIFTQLGETQCGRWGHVFLNICGHWYNAANPTDDIVGLRSSYSGSNSCGSWNAEFRIPPGLEDLTWASCSAACTPGCTPATCPNDPSGGNVGGGSGGGGDCTNIGADGNCEETIVGYLKKWWDSEFLPALKDMTAQLYSYRIFETRQLGRMMDAQDISKAARVEQEQRVTTQQSDLPHEGVCVAGSYPNAMSQSTVTATALTKGFKQDLQRRSANAIQAAPYAPGPDPVTDQKIRWAEYCTEFQDPANNNGVSACPNPTTPGLMPNGDISIEGFLLKDTINMNNPDEYKTAMALLKNLVQPMIRKRIPEFLVNTTQGREYIIKQQHLDSIDNITRDVVSSIISRRTGLAPTFPGGGKPVGEMIKDIRTKAGVDPANISANPSYNEIMLALTKERFFDPEYFVRMENNPGALKQEQTAINAYTTIQLQDIYRLQEQINALLAARAALKFAPDQNRSQVEQNPSK